MHEARPSILFVCTGNCCRSHIAEGMMRHLAGDRFDVFSAGSHPTGYVHPLAIDTMDEAGIDISGQRSKGLDEFADRAFDYVVTLCGHAQAHCPALRGRVATWHWPLKDPAMFEGDFESAEQTAREVREELRARLEAMLRSLS